jgi:hypothetical protein
VSPQIIFAVLLTPPVASDTLMFVRPEGRQGLPPPYPPTIREMP